MTILFQEKTPLYSSSQPVAPPRSSVPSIQPTAQQRSFQPPGSSTAYRPPYPQANSINAPYPIGPVSMPQPYSAPQPNQPPYPTVGSYRAPYQPYPNNIPSPPSVPSKLDQSVQAQSNSTQPLNRTNQNTSSFSGYNTIQPSHIRASLTSAIDDRLRQRLKELMGDSYFYTL